MSNKTKTPAWPHITFAVILGLITYGLVLYTSNIPPQTPEITIGPKPQTSHQIGRTIPPFSFTDINDNTHKIENFKGKTIILNFWASWCAPCIKEFPNLLKAAASDQQNIVLIALSSDFEQEAMKRFLKKLEKQNPEMKNTNVLIAHDPEGQTTEKTFGVKTLPQTLIINGKQKLKYKLSGANWTLEDLMNHLSTP